MTPLVSNRLGQSHRRIRRWVLGTVGTMALSTAAIGALHMPFARSFMMRLGGCPMAGVHMTAAETDTARHMGLAENPVASLNAGSAPVRPALGFQLDATTLADVHAWASRVHVDCDDIRDGVVKCTDVSPSAVSRSGNEGHIDELVLAFNPRGRLVNITALRSHLKPGSAAQAAQQIASALASELGTAKTAGGFDAERLSKAGAESLGVVSYRFTNYVANVTAMNLPGSGASVREHYMSAND
jgi:hypothetical protein